MIKHIGKSAYNLTTLGFPSIYQGREVKVTVSLNAGYYDVHINGTLMAKINFDENRYTWYLVHGNLNDPDLVKEIGERIEAKNN